MHFILGRILILLGRIVVVATGEVRGGDEIHLSDGYISSYIRRTRRCEVAASFHGVEMERGALHVSLLLSAGAEVITPRSCRICLLTHSVSFFCPFFTSSLVN